MRLSPEMSYCVCLCTRGCSVNMINLQTMPGMEKPSVIVQFVTENTEMGVSQRVVPLLNLSNRKKAKQKS